MIEACRRGDEAATARCALADYYTEHLPHRTLDIWQLKMADFPIVFKDEMPRTAHGEVIYNLPDPDGLPVVAPDMRIRGWRMRSVDFTEPGVPGRLTFVSRRRWGPNREYGPVGDGRKS
jgi:hypothetical protein